MAQRIAQLTLVVRDYDEALAFYVGKLGFSLLEDTLLTDDKRWVVVAPPSSTGSSILLARAATEEQKRSVGKQTGGRVFLFLATDDFWRDYIGMVQRGIVFVRSPKEEAYGTVAVFADLYGNLWDLIEYRTGHPFADKGG